MTEEIKKKIQLRINAKIIENKSNYALFNEGMLKGAEIAKDIIQHETRWRKVEEELPPLGKTVWLKNENMDMERFKYDKGFREEYQTSDGWYWSDVHIQQEYTHWKPID